MAQASQVQQAPVPAAPGQAMGVKTNVAATGSGGLRPLPPIVGTAGTPEYRRSIAARNPIKEENFARGYRPEDMGLFNRKEEGQSTHSQYGPGGFYSEYGGGTSPVWEYNWQAGVKRHQATSDPVANQTWVPIEQAEFDSYRDQQAWNADHPGASYYDRLAWNRVQQDLSAGHLTRDPSSGKLFNDPGNNPAARQWFDEFGRPTQGPAGWTPGAPGPGTPGTPGVPTPNKISMPGGANAQQAAPMVMNRVPRQWEIDQIPVGVAVETPLGTLTRDPTGQARVTLNERGQQMYLDKMRQATKRFGPRPMMGDSSMPQPEIILGKPNYNPWTRSWS